jgi:hypothetical protein
MIMSKQALNTLKNWFKTGLKPTQLQFWDWLDSFWHKDEPIPVDKVEGLAELLGDSVSLAQFSSGLAGKSDLVHTHSGGDLVIWLGYTPQNVVEKNQPEGYAGLDMEGKIYLSQLPAIAINNTFVVADEEAMLLLEAETGDVAVRLDESKSYILAGEYSSDLSDWQELLTPVSPVTSVFGRTGNVTAQSGDYTTAQVTESGNMYFTTARVLATALSGFLAAPGTVSDSDTVLSAIQKIVANLNTCVKQSGNETIAGEKTFSTGIVLSYATPNTIAEVDANGNLIGETATAPLYLPAIHSAIPLLENLSNWVSQSYVGPTISGTYQGQKHYSNAHLFECVEDNFWIRLTRG